MCLGGTCTYTCVHVYNLGLPRNQTHTPTCTHTYFCHDPCVVSNQNIKQCHIQHTHVQVYVGQSHGTFYFHYQCSIDCMHQSNLTKPKMHTTPYNHSSHNPLKSSPHYLNKHRTENDIKFHSIPYQLKLLDS